MKTKNSFNIDHLSPSQLEEYVFCPKKYKYKRIDKIEEKIDESNLNLEYGKSIHATIDYFYKNFINQKVSNKVLNLYFENHFVETLKLNKKYTKNNIELINELIPLAHHFIYLYCKNIARERNVLMNEKTLIYPIDNIPIINTLDVVYEGDADFLDCQPVIIEDIKTAAKNYSENEIIVGLQIKSYAYALEYNFPKLKVQGIQYTVFVKNTGKIQQVYMDLLEGWKEEFEEETKEIIKGIQNDVFPKNPIPKSFKCSSCPFFEYCWKTQNNQTVIKTL